VESIKMNLDSKDQRVPKSLPRALQENGMDVVLVLLVALGVHPALLDDTLMLALDNYPLTCANNVHLEISRSLVVLHVMW
jgi:hypothetical protein